MNSPSVCERHCLSPKVGCVVIVAERNSSNFENVCNIPFCPRSLCPQHRLQQGLCLFHWTRAFLRAWTVSLGQRPPPGWNCVSTIRLEPSSGLRTLPPDLPRALFSRGPSQEERPRQCASPALHWLISQLLLQLRAMARCLILPSPSPFLGVVLPLPQETGLESASSSPPPLLASCLPHPSL